MTTTHPAQPLIDSVKGHPAMTTPRTAFVLNGETPVRVTVLRERQHWNMTGYDVTNGRTRWFTLTLFDTADEASRAAGYMAAALDL